MCNLNDIEALLYDLKVMMGRQFFPNYYQTKLFESLFDENYCFLDDSSVQRLDMIMPCSMRLVSSGDVASHDHEKQRTCCGRERVGSDGDGGVWWWW